MFALKRIQRELKDIFQNEEASQRMIRLDMVNDSLQELRGEIAGPSGTPYEGGLFVLKIKVPQTYPFTPPEVSFVTKVWHPNISSVTGAICLDILKDEWAGSMTLRTVLMSLQILLATPEPDDPQDAVVAKQCIENPEMFELTAKHWTQVYAGAPKTPSDFDAKIKILVNMDVEEKKARDALSCCSWNLKEAKKSLFG
ncbi:hypothetical protein JTE90_023961 [Oedothorax gibbosus]|uniref:E2 ubiquitin-conjugating enzyme n=1 Tax=Oedothorax gibbosus TaxID=931172 RepID=A0AAV6UQM0_9ARAC|nr:hypothetical protein JTE90_023961 [Oedothorax gibbosus]